MPTYVIVAESGADIPPHLAQRYNISIVPMHVSLGNETFEDGAISVEEALTFYDKTKQLPTTSGCTPADFAKVFDRIHQENPEALIIHLAYSAVTTISFESALTAAQGRDYVHHFDTKTVSLGQAMVVLSIAEHIAENPDIELDELKRVIAQRIAGSHLGFLPGDLSYLRAGGRLSNASFLGAQLLKVAPFVELVNGKLVATKMYRGPMLKIAQKMAEEFIRKAKFDSRYFYLLSSPGLKSDVIDAVEALMERLGVKHAGWLQPGCVVACHSGPKAFGIVGLATT